MSRLLERVGLRIATGKIEKLLNGKKTYLTIVFGLGFAFQMLSGGDYVGFAQEFASNPDPEVIINTTLAAALAFMRMGMKNAVKGLEDRAIAQEAKERLKVPVTEIDRAD